MPSTLRSPSPRTPEPRESWGAVSWSPPLVRRFAAIEVPRRRDSLPSSRRIQLSRRCNVACDTDILREVPFFALLDDEEVAGLGAPGGLAKVAPPPRHALPRGPGGRGRRRRPGARGGRG